MRRFVPLAQDLESAFMLYVQLAPKDVWSEYARAIQARARLDSAPLR